MLNKVLEILKGVFGFDDPMSGVRQTYIKDCLDHYDPGTILDRPFALVKSCDRFDERDYGDILGGVIRIKREDDVVFIPPQEPQYQCQHCGAGKVNRLDLCPACGAPEPCGPGVLPDNWKFYSTYVENNLPVSGQYRPREAKDE